MVVGNDRAHLKLLRSDFELFFACLVRVCESSNFFFFTWVKQDVTALTATWCSWLVPPLFLGLPLLAFTQGCTSMYCPDNMAYIFMCYAWLCNTAYFYWELLCLQWVCMEVSCNLFLQKRKRKRHLEMLWKGTLKCCEKRQFKDQKIVQNELVRAWVRKLMTSCSPRFSCVNLERSANNYCSLCFYLLKNAIPTTQFLCQTALEKKNCLKYKTTTIKFFYVLHFCNCF